MRSRRKVVSAVPRQSVATNQREVNRVTRHRHDIAPNWTSRPLATMINLLVHLLRTLTQPTHAPAWHSSRASGNQSTNRRVAKRVTGDDGVQSESGNLCRRPDGPICLCHEPVNDAKNTSVRSTAS